MSQSQFVPKGQGLRFNRQGNSQVAKETAKADAISKETLLNRRNALLQEYNKVHQKPAWSPAYNAAVRILLIIRVSSAMYSIIKDCDESFNYWEPLHLLVFTPPKAAALTPSNASFQAPFQTWEYSPEYAIRSWAYLLQYVPLARTLAVLGLGKRQIFFAIRLLLAFTSTLIEARFYKAVADTFNARVGRYVLVALAFSAGMFEASTALLPSSFAMHATMLAFSFSLYPARLSPTDPSVLATPTQRSFKPYRILGAVASFAAGAIVGWPFAIVLSAPFVIEQLFFRGDDIVPPKSASNWLVSRWSTFIGAALVSSIIAVPLFVFDTLAYGRSSLVPFNIISYNVLSKQRGAGPELYGTEPFSFYFTNLSLNFNFLFPLALLSTPLLILTAKYDPRRLARPLETAQSAKGHAKAPEPSSLFSLVALRLSPFYVWFILMTLQSHKEERFMYPAYPLLVLNAAIALYLVRSLSENAYVRFTKSPYKASKSKLFTSITSTTLLLTALLGILRIVGQLSHYHAPLDVLFHLEGYELPRVVASLFPESLNPAIKARIAKGLNAVPTSEEREYNERGYGKENAGISQDLSISLAPLQTLDEPIRLCYGKEWHRFPNHFMVPAGVEVQFIKSEFSGILPKHFDASVHGVGFENARDSAAATLDSTLGWLWPWRDITRRSQTGFNDLNLEEQDRYVPVESCDYLVDLDYSHRFLSESSKPPALEPRYAVESSEWDRVYCKPFLDAEWSRAVGLPSESILTRFGKKVAAAVFRTLWLPSGWKGSSNLYGDYCLLKNKASSRVA